MIKELNVQDLIWLAMKKWWIIVSLALVFAIVFCLASIYIIPEKYESYGSIYVNNKAQEIVESTTINNTANLYDLTTAELLVQTYKEILKSNNFFTMIINNTNLEYRPEQLKSMVRYESIKETGIIKVYVVAYSPEEANLICSSIMKYANYAIMDIVEVGSVKTIDEATIPLAKTSPNTTKNTFLGFVFGFIVAFIVLILMYYLDTRVKSVEDIERKYDVVILGTIPSIDFSKIAENGGVKNA